ncbi:MAG: GLPGLI family protein, partial [Flavobacteriia bacterium]|nr:GLPGLI family protein [Flavobacteriia bacterium]
MKCGSIILGLIALFTVQSVHGQLVQYGKITYERRTNLYKKFDDERMRQWIKEADKIKTDKFALYFNDSISMFSYITPEEEDQMSWVTTKNTVYANHVKDERVVYMDMWGTQLTITDSLVDRKWKITDKTRKIAGYECTRAIWQKDDTTRIYAWFTTDIIPTVGPESVQGLPGAVLGLATEDARGLRPGHRSARQFLDRSHPHSAVEPSLRPPRRFPQRSQVRRRRAPGRQRQSVRPGRKPPRRDGQHHRRLQRVGPRRRSRQFHSPGDRVHHRHGRNDRRDLRPESS